MADKNSPDFFDDMNWDLDSPTVSDAELDALLGELNLQFSPDETLPVEEPKPITKAPSHAAPRHESEKKSPTKPKSERKQPPRQEPEDIEPSTFLDAVAQHRGVINACLCLIALVLVAGIAALILFQDSSDPYNGRILSNVSVAGVDVGGMKTSEALEAVNAIVGNSFSQNDMVIILGRDKVVLSPNFTHVNFNAKQAVEAAYAFGRTGSSSQRAQDSQLARTDGKDIPLDPYLGLDLNYVRSVLEEEICKISGEYVPSGFALEGARPSLDADTFDEETPCQTLVLTLGFPGANADMESIVQTIMAAYSRNEFTVTIPQELLANFPEELDLETIHADLSIAPVEAVESTGTPGSCGYTFSLEKAKEALATANYGDVISIPMEYVRPTKLDIYGDFPEVIATYSSPIGSDADYNKNMELICQSIDGTVLQPGEVFSFNTVCTARTAENGFLSAPTHDIYCSTKDLNAGADQVASTMYVCAVNADFPILERHNADHACGYTIRGTELTVAQNWEDLKFRNNTEQAVKIRAKVSDSRVIIRILGSTLTDYYISLESESLSTSTIGTNNVFFPADSGYKNQEVLFEGLAGGQIQLYRVKYDRATQAEISRTREAYINVTSANKIVAQVQ